MAVLASVQDRVEAWNKSVKMPQLDEDSGETMTLALTLTRLDDGVGETRVTLTVTPTPPIAKLDAGIGETTALLASSS